MGRAGERGTEDRRQMTEDRGQTTDDGRLRTEGRRGRSAAGEKIGDSG